MTWNDFYVYKYISAMAQLESMYAQIWRIWLNLFGTHLNTLPLTYVKNYKIVFDTTLSIQWSYSKQMTHYTFKSKPFIYIWARSQLGIQSTLWD